MAYVQVVYTSALRNDLQRFRPFAEDIYIELISRIDAWKECESEDMEAKVKYAPFETLLNDLENDYRDLSSEYPREDCQQVARVITVMLMTLFFTVRKEGAAYVHLSNALFNQLFTAFELDSEQTLAFTNLFAPQRSKGIGEWMTEYLRTGELISNDIETVITIIEDKMKEEQNHSGGITFDKEDIFRLLREQKPNVIVKEGAIANMEGSNPTFNISYGQKETLLTPSNKLVVEALKSLPKKIKGWCDKCWWSAWKYLTDNGYLSMGMKEFGVYLMDMEITSKNPYENYRKEVNLHSNLSNKKTADWLSQDGLISEEGQRHINVVKSLQEALT